MIPLEGEWDENWRNPRFVRIDGKGGTLERSNSRFAANRLGFKAVVKDIMFIPVRVFGLIVGSTSV